MSVEEKQAICFTKLINVDSIMQKIDSSMVKNAYVMPDVERHFPMIMQSMPSWKDVICKFLFHAANFANHNNDPTFKILTTGCIKADKVSIYVASCIRSEFRSLVNIANETKRITVLAAALMIANVNESDEDEDENDEGAEIEMYGAPVRYQQDVNVTRMYIAEKPNFGGIIDPKLG